MGFLCLCLMDPDPWEQARLIKALLNLRRGSFIFLLTLDFLPFMTEIKGKCFHGL